MKICALPSFPEGDVLKKIEIKYPVDKAYRTFLYNGRTHEIFELIKFKENFRSWFVGDYVYQDGSLFLVTKVDAVLVFLNFISQTESKFNDTYHVVGENDALYKCLTKNKNINLEVVADVKMVDGDTYVKYNPEKTIKYLKYKVAKLNQCLKANSIQVTDSFVKVAGLDGKQENASEGDYTAFSINLIADYAPKNLIDKLLELYNIREEEPAKKASPNKKPQDKKRKFASDEPVDDYSKLIPSDAFTKKQKVLTRGEKALEKVDKSKIKPITSFFQKKSSW